PRAQSRGATGDDRIGLRTPRTHRSGLRIVDSGAGRSMFIVTFQARNFAAAREEGSTFNPSVVRLLIQPSLASQSAFSYFELASSATLSLLSPRCGSSENITPKPISRCFVIGIQERRMSSLRICCGAQ